MTVSPFGRVYFSNGTDNGDSLFLVVQEKSNAIRSISDTENNFFILRILSLICAEIELRKVVIFCVDRCFFDYKKKVIIFAPDSWAHAREAEQEE